MTLWRALFSYEVEFEGEVEVEADDEDAAREAAQDAADQECHGFDEIDANLTLESIEPVPEVEQSVADHLAAEREGQRHMLGLWVRES